MKKINHTCKFSIIPEFILQDPNIDTIDYRVYGYLSCLYAVNTKKYPSREILATKLHTTRSSIARALIKLETLQYIYIIHTNNTNKYVIRDVGNTEWLLAHEEGSKKLKRKKHKKIDKPSNILHFNFRSKKSL
jgi:hypothetical protein